MPPSPSLLTTRKRFAIVVPISGSDGAVAPTGGATATVAALEPSGPGIATVASPSGAPSRGQTLNESAYSVLQVGQRFIEFLFAGGVWATRIARRRE